MIRLREGEAWIYVPPQGQDVLWISVHAGTVAAPDGVEIGDVAVFQGGTGPVTFRAAGDARFVLGSAARHRHALTMGHYSVHTSSQNLEAGERRVRRIGAFLRRDGKLEP